MFRVLCILVFICIHYCLSISYLEASKRAYPFPAFYHSGEQKRVHTCTVRGVYLNSQQKNRVVHYNIVVAIWDLRHASISRHSQAHSLMSFGCFWRHSAPLWRQSFPCNQTRRQNATDKVRAVRHRHGSASYILTPCGAKTVGDYWRAILTVQFPTTMFCTALALSICTCSSVRTANPPQTLTFP